MYCEADDDAGIFLPQDGDRGQRVRETDLAALLCQFLGLLLLLCDLIGATFANGSLLLPPSSPILEWTHHPPICWWDAPIPNHFPAGFRHEDEVD